MPDATPNAQCQAPDAPLCFTGCPALRAASKKFSGHGNAALQTSAVYALYADGHQGCVTAYNVSVSDTYDSSRWKPVDGGRTFRPPVCAAESFFRNPVHARFLRIQIIEWNVRASLKATLIVPDQKVRP